MKPLLNILAVVIIASAFWSFAPAALAQNIGFTGESGKSTLDLIAKDAGFATNIKDSTLIETTAGQLIAIFLGFLGILFLSLVIYSGWQWMTAGGNEEKVSEAKQRIKNAVLGLALIFFAYIISNLVFKFLYQESGRPTGPAPQSCQRSADCPEGMECIQNICQGELEGGIECQNNNDCPPEQPVCETLGFSLGGRDVGYKYCTCDNDGQCILNNGQNYWCQKRALQTNICITYQCNAHADCSNNELGFKCLNHVCGCATQADCLDNFVCDTTNGLCLRNECETDADCSYDEAGFKCLAPVNKKVCGCASNDDCPVQYTCNEQSGRCEL